MGKFQEFTHHQSQQVSNLQAQMQAQSQQLHGQIETQNQSIQAMFENQLSHIRGLLQKRPRDDGEWWGGHELPSSHNGMMMMGSCCAMWALAALMPLLFQLLGCVSTAFPVRGLPPCQVLVGCVVALFQCLPDWRGLSSSSGYWQFQFCVRGDESIWFAVQSALCCCPPWPMGICGQWVKRIWVPRMLLVSMPVCDLRARLSVRSWVVILLCRQPQGQEAGKGLGSSPRCLFRHVPTSWPVENSTFIQGHGFLHPWSTNVWLTGGVVYGEPDSHYYPSRLQHNEALLRAVTDSVGFLSSGPRFVAGDWNVASGELPVFGVLEGLGLKACKTLQQSAGAFLLSLLVRQGRARISATYRLNCNTSSFKWCDRWCLARPCHALGSLSSVGWGLQEWCWRTPGPFPWPRHWDVPPDCLAIRS